MFMRKHGATASSFDTIVASGERSALPHGVASERVIQGNEFVTFDFGASLTDTAPISPEPLRSEVLILS